MTACRSLDPDLRRAAVRGADKTFVRSRRRAGAGQLRGHSWSQSFRSWPCHRAGTAQHPPRPGRLRAHRPPWRCPADPNVRWAAFLHDWKTGLPVAGRKAPVTLRAQRAGAQLVQKILTRLHAPKAALPGCRSWCACTIWPCLPPRRACGAGCGAWTRRTDAAGRPAPGRPDRPRLHSLGQTAPGPAGRVCGNRPRTAGGGRVLPAGHAGGERPG